MVGCSGVHRFIAASTIGDLAYDERRDRICFKVKMRLYRHLQLLLVPTVVACEAAPERTSIRALQAGDPAPEYAAPTLAGDTISLTDLRGQAVMLNVWATWCIPCRDEMPALQALHDEHGANGLRILGVSIDAAGMNGDIEQFVNERGLTFTILHDPAERVSRVFRTRAVPETYLFDRKGQLVRRWIGQFDPLAADTRRDVTRALESD
jgi:cytochrome c biogenesis protein CcmG/thiol:disulfide interchange protein DsbE